MVNRFTPISSGLSELGRNSGARAGHSETGTRVVESAQDRRLIRLASRPVNQVKSVGEKRAAALGEIGIETVLDLVTHYPRRYIDRSKRLPIAGLVVGEQATVVAIVSKVTTRRMRNHRTLVTVDFRDDTGGLRATFFNQAWRARQLSEGVEVVLAGKVDEYRGWLQMSNPVVNLIDAPGESKRTDRVIPIYPQSEKAGLTTWEIETAVREALRRMGELSDPIDSGFLDSHGLISRDEAIRKIHSPSEIHDWQSARRRLAFDELLRLQLVLMRRRRETEERLAGIAHRTEGRYVKALFSRLPFAPTKAQLQAVEDIVADMASESPMHRLLQGDVGSGKTVVALAALLTVVESGHQGAILVPTEVLAEQHFASISSLAEGLAVPDPSNLMGERSIGIELVTNKTTKVARARLTAAMRAGQVDIVIGTHALLSGQVEFPSLGLVVVDEQHRFGVDQRAALQEAGRATVEQGGQDEDERVPDLLVMTATPIPRTVAMTVFGDLDTSVLAEMPAGRKPVKTKWLPDDPSDAWARVTKEASVGRQAYVVCPLVSESEAIEAASVEAEAQRLAAGPLKGLTIAVVHGQMPSANKASSMESFRSGEADVLVSTTVIEVGIDVPNATVMVIEDAARFGIAQLHQLRGRVGRGAHQSWCYLTGGATTPDGVKRLEALVATTDGFELAERDLEIRGEGSVLGAEQSGFTNRSFKLAKLSSDRELVEIARKVASDLLDRDPGLAGHAELAEEIEVLLEPADADYLFKS